MKVKHSTYQTRKRLCAPPLLVSSGTHYLQLGRRGAFASPQSLIGLFQRRDIKEKIKLFGMICNFSSNNHFGKWETSIYHKISQNRLVKSIVEEIFCTENKFKLCRKKTISKRYFLSSRVPCFTKVSLKTEVRQLKCTAHISRRDFELSLSTKFS